MRDSFQLLHRTYPCFPFNENVELNGLKKTRNVALQIIAGDTRLYWKGSRYLRTFMASLILPTYVRYISRSKLTHDNISSGPSRKNVHVRRPPSRRRLIYRWKATSSLAFGSIIFLMIALLPDRSKWVIMGLKGRCEIHKITAITSSRAAPKSSDCEWLETVFGNLHR